MKADPFDPNNVGTITAPPRHGPGSGKEAWIRFALETADANDNAFAIIREQAEAIRQRDAEIELLRRQIAERKPKGGRPRLSDDVVARIEADLARGYSQRQTAARNGVSAMTVSRIAKRASKRS